MGTKNTRGFGRQLRIHRLTLERLEPRCLLACPTDAFDIKDLGSLTEDGPSYATAVYDEKFIAGRSTDSGMGSPLRAVAYDASTTPPTATNLGVLSGGNSSGARSVTAVGDVGYFVGYSETDVAGAIVNRAFIRSTAEGEVMKSLHPTDSSYGAGSEAYWINDDLTSVGWVHTSNGVPVGFYHDEDLSPAFQTIGSLMAGGASWAHAINDRAAFVIAGAADVLVGSAVQNHAVRYSIQQGLVDLGTFSGGTYSVAYAVNKNGEIAGASNSSTHSGRAFLIRTGGAMMNLGVLGNGRSSVAWGINDDGKVVGFSQGSPNPSTFDAFIWDSTNGMCDLNKMIANEPDWDLENARDINNAGYIVGGGQTPPDEFGRRRRHSYLLIPHGPGPSDDEGGSARSFVGFDTAMAERLTGKNQAHIRPAPSSAMLIDNLNSPVQPPRESTLPSVATAATQTTRLSPASAQIRNEVFDTLIDVLMPALSG